MAHENVLDGTSPNSDAEEDFIPTFTDRVRIILCPDATVVDGEHINTRKTRFACPQTVV
jgi:hypothetical protein